jgi:hypothetical protein
MVMNTLEARSRTIGSRYGMTGALGMAWSGEEFPKGRWT